MRKIFLFIICLGLSINAFSQVKEITGDESVQELVEAYGKLKETSWRKKQKTEYYKNGKLLNVEEEIEESVKPDKQRFLRTERRGKIINKSEIIIIGDIYYCRKNKGTWIKSESDCGDKFFITGRGEEVSSRYTVEEIKLNNQNTKLFRQYDTYNDGKGLNYWDYKFWINEDDFIIQREIETGLVKTKEILSRMTEIIQINPIDLKIEAPIK